MARREGKLRSENWVPNDNDSIRAQEIQHQKNEEEIEDGRQRQGRKNLEPPNNKLVLSPCHRHTTNQEGASQPTNTGSHHPPPPSHFPSHPPITTLLQPPPQPPLFPAYRISCTFRAPSRNEEATSQRASEPALPSHEPRAVPRQAARLRRIPNPNPVLNRFLADTGLAGGSFLLRPMPCLVFVRVASAVLSSQRRLLESFFPLRGLRMQGKSWLDHGCEGCLCVNAGKMKKVKCPEG